MRKVMAILLAASLGGCATTGDRAALDPRDPMEGFNRGVWAFNDAADTVVIKPASTVYRTVTPIPARRGIVRVFQNLTEPLSFVNNLLQGKPGRAFNSLGRFLINSTIGIGGLADHATDLGLKPTREDFGQTFAAWGMKKSPYLVLPLLGPSTVRDGVGTALQFATDPTQILLSEAGATGTDRAIVTGVRLVDQRSQVTDSGFDAVLETSADPYAAARSTYFQRREAQIADEDAGALAPADQDEGAILDEALKAEQDPDAPVAAPAAQPAEPDAVEPEEPVEKEPETPQS